MRRALIEFVTSLSFVLVISFPPAGLKAQDKSKEGENLFKEDTKPQQDARDATVKEVLTTDAPGSPDLDFRAPIVERLEQGNKIKGSGGVIMSRQGAQYQAQETTVSLDTNEAELAGEVLFTDPFTSLKCDTAKFNIDTETGQCVDAKFLIEDGGYYVAAKEAQKQSETLYDLTEGTLTTCHCADGSAPPWRIHCSRGSVEEEGYLHAQNAWIDMHGVPFFYAPYFVFPAKSERASGLLAPEFGYGSEDGVIFRQPVFAVIDDSTDATFSPFIETKTRFGTGLELRKSFSKRHNFEGRLIYSDESERDGDLRGTNVTGLFDPTFDEDRLGAYAEHSWRNDKDAAIPMGWSTEVHYVSDDLFLREIEDNDIGESNANYLTSQTLFSASLSDYVAAELGGEFNQSLSGDDDDLVFQRLPEVRIYGAKSYRPFGYNPYGFKLVPGGRVTATDFVRDEGYDGWRSDVSPVLRLPFHYQNYLTSDLTFGLLNTFYNLDNQEDPSGGSDLDSSSDRSLFTASWKVGTALERVFELPENNILTTLTSLGSKNQENRLRRVKQVIEPYIKYSFVPGTDQDELPLFDSYDRIRQRSLFSFGARTSLLGRFLPLYPGAEQITELTPLVHELPVVGSENALPDSGEIAPELGAGNLDNVRVRSGEIREIAYMEVRESYDYTEDQKELDPSRRSWSDLAVDFGILPSQNFKLELQSNYDARDLIFSSWALGAFFSDDRGDLLGGRYTFIDEQLGQLEGHIEVALNDRLSLGYYGRFDEKESESIENNMALRFRSACNCWHVDVGFSDKLNPDRQEVLLTLSLGGIGDLGQGLRLGDRER